MTRRTFAQLAFEPAPVARFTLVPVTWLLIVQTQKSMLSPSGKDTSQQYVHSRQAT
jgi:hypothetical protein